jgi:flagellar biosynthesis/type III secretory pathway protein FliH
LEPEAAKPIQEAGRGWEREFDAYFDVLLQVNSEAFMEAWNMANNTKTFAEEDLWLRSPTNDLEPGAARTIVKAETGGKMDAYFNVLIRANPEAFLEAWMMANSTRTFEEVFTEAGIIPQWIERGKKEGKEEGKKEGKETVAKNLLAKGWTVEDVAETAELPLEKVRSLAVN